MTEEVIEDMAQDQDECVEDLMETNQYF